MNEKMVVAIQSAGSPYVRYRSSDGWPLCPACGEDELWSPTSRALNIVSCYACGWRPPIGAQPISAELLLDAIKMLEAIPDDSGKVK